MERRFHELTPKKCPPEDAAVPNGEYFRFVYHNPPVAEDFVIWIQEPENKHLLAEKIREKDVNCVQFAISLLTEDGVSRSNELFAQPLKEKARKRGATSYGWAKIKLDHRSGTLKQTGRNPFHYDLWPDVAFKFEDYATLTKGL
ncbi:MAG: hypothetical protein HUU55_18665 [Myxococcales bacterium]|nr:hypothetical protein [Myxococcales bacterium]